MSSDKIVVVTGACGQLGKAIVKDLSERELPLILIDKDKDVLNYEDVNKSILAYSFDAGNEELMAEILESASGKLGKTIGYLLYCAGIMSYGSIMEEPAEKYLDTFRQNVLNPIIATKCVLPYMMKNKFGRILYVSSVFSEITRKNFSSYSISKAGLKAFMETTVKEYSEYNISANCIAPGLMRTKFINKFLASMMEDKNLVDSYALLPRAFVKVRETARLCISVLLDYEAINGQTIVIDNGYSKMV